MELSRQWVSQVRNTEGYHCSILEAFCTLQFVALEEKGQARYIQPFPLFSPATQQYFNPEITDLKEIEISSHSEKEVNATLSIHWLMYSSKPITKRNQKCAAQQQQQK